MNERIKWLFSYFLWICAGLFILPCVGVATLAQKWFDYAADKPGI